jgi:hypothetical protein
MNYGLFAYVIQIQGVSIVCQELFQTNTTNNNDILTALDNALREEYPYEYRKEGYKYHFLSNQITMWVLDYNFISKRVYNEILEEKKKIKS